MKTYAYTHNPFELITSDFLGLCFLIAQIEKVMYTPMALHIYVPNLTNHFGEISHVYVRKIAHLCVMEIEKNEVIGLNEKRE